MRMRQQCCLLLILQGVATAWISTAPRRTTPIRQSTSKSKLCAETNNNSNNNNGGWSPADDWDVLSAENLAFDSDTVYNVDVVSQAANSMQQHPASSFQDDDCYESSQIIDTIHENDSDGVALFDTGFDELSQNTFEDEMGREISMLVRCNESPDVMNVEEGRAVAPLSLEEKNDPSQLVLKKENKYKPTPFFSNAIATLFHEHSTALSSEEPVMDAKSVAGWMSKSLGATVRKHDKRVLLTISKFGDYGAGYLTLENFETLYLAAVVDSLATTTIVHDKPDSHKRANSNTKPTIDSVWSDLRNHGIMSPVEQERAQLQSEVLAGKEDIVHDDESSLYDECEILDYGTSTLPETKSSYERVELCSDNQTPKRLRDGDFVFIDEQSCIGCAKCVQICPSSFQMLENGRARTFEQRHFSPDVKEAVSVCPVDCMHRVSFAELKEMETARDTPDWETADRRNLNHKSGNIPLHVAGMDSDANHRSSWYHYLKHKCHMSQKCPSQGCFDCPHFANPGDNPFFKARHRRDEHRRAVEFSDSGFRKTAEL